MLYSIVAALVIIFDQAVKNWVSNTLFGEDVVTFIPGVISLVNVQNDGAAFSFLSGSGARIYFIILTGIFTVAVIVALATNFISGRLSRWSLVLVTAGGLANCIDRIIYGYVQDMFKVELFNFAIFNVADIFITVFAIIFAIAMIFERQEDDDDEYYDEDEEEEKPKRVKKERAPLLSRFKKDSDLDDEDDDDYEDRRPANRKSRGGKRAKYETDYEQYKAQRSTQPQKAARPQTENPSSGDPFAEWEKASASVAAQRNSSAASKAMGVSAPQRQPAARPQQAAQPQQSAQAVARPQPSAQPAARPQPSAQPAARPQPSAQPAARPQQNAQATSSKPATNSDGFNLDDILAEFK